MILNRFVGSLTLGALALVASAQYNVVDLGVLPGTTSSIAYGLSENNWVVGGSGLSAFRWSASTGMVQLNGLGGSSTQAYGVNDLGIAVGSSATGVNFDRHAVLWNGISATDIHETGTLSEARAINNAGTIVGSNNSNAFRRPAAGSMQNLPDLGGLSNATAINTLGVVGGWAYNTSDIQHATRWSASNTLTDLGVPATKETSFVNGINDNGYTVGGGSLGGTFYAFRDTGLGPQVLNGLYTYDNRAYDINLAGYTVGHSWLTFDGNTSQAVIWAPEALNPTNLNDQIDAASGWQLQRATAINDRGFIVGYGIHNGVSRAFLLEPVPEPASLTVLGIGALALLRRRKR